jgi:hypothetical protein
MRFFSKLTCICNFCFIISIPLRLIEIINNKKAGFNGAIPLQPLESTVVILGTGAVILNLFFCIASVYWFYKGRIKQLPLWIVLFNLVLFPVQIVYFSLKS